MTGGRWYWIILQLVAVGTGIYLGVGVFDAVAR